MFSAGTSIWGLRLAVEKRAARKEARQLILQGIDKAKLHVLSFRKSSDALARLEWKHEGEFRLEGQLYDIVSSRESADSVHYTCYPDTRESNVDARIGALCKLLFGQQPLQQQREQQWVSFLRGLMLPQEPLQLEALHADAAGEISAELLVAMDGYPEAFLPPPEVFLLFAG